MELLNCLSQRTSAMLMRNLDYKSDTETEHEPSSQAYSPRNSLLGQFIVLLVIVIAILLRDFVA